MKSQELIEGCKERFDELQEERIKKDNKWKIK